jgi:2-dehydrotetronate isomerase
MVRFSANLGFLWPDRPLLQRIEAAALAGFKAVELHWPYDVPAEAVKQTCARHRVKLLGLNTHPGDTAAGDFGLGAVAGREAEFQASVDQAISYCVGSGAESIHAMAGVVAPEQRQQASEVFTHNLLQAADKAAEHGLTLLLEAINPRDKPGYFYSTLADVADVMAAVGRTNVRMMFDVYHVGLAEGDVLAKLDRYLPLVGHVQIASVPARAEPDQSEVPYSAVFEALDALGYDGWVGCEYKPRAGTDKGLAWIKALGVEL